MDDFVKTFLTARNLESCISSFEENQIDEEAFRSLTDSDIKELIPVLGLRKKFVSSFQSCKKDENLITEAEILSEASSNFSVFSTDADSVDDHPTTCIHAADLILQPQLYCSYKPNVGAPFVPNTDIEKNSVLQLLDKSGDSAQIIYNSYGDNKVFKRKELCHLIIKNELDLNPDKHISTERFKQLAEEIYAIFIHEHPSIYYIPYSKTQNGKVLTAKGKLWNSYVYMRRRLRESNILPSRKQAAIPSTSLCENDLVSDGLLWLENNIEPLNTAREYWRESFNKRTLIGSLGDFVQKYKFVTHTIGYLFFEDDFSQLYPGVGNKLLSNYNILAAKIIKFADAKRGKDSFINATFANYNESYTTKTEDSDFIFSMRLLPLMLQNSLLKSKEGLRWKPSKIELQEGFLLCIENASFLKDALQKRLQKYACYELTAQPIPVIVGPWNDLNQVTSYVSWNDVLYKLETPARAIDICFKLFMAVNLKYPHEVQSVWTFMQQAVYGINLPSDKYFTSVKSLATDLKL